MEDGTMTKFIKHIREKSLQYKSKPLLLSVIEIIGFFLSLLVLIMCWLPSTLGLIIWLTGIGLSLICLLKSPRIIAFFSLSLALLAILISSITNVVSCI